MKTDPPQAQSPTHHINEVVSNSPIKQEIIKDRRGLGSAPKAVANSIIGTPVESDPFGGNIPTRKKIVNRIDQELESRGSIFSGRDEKSVLMQKRNLQQQHMREELLRQIEEKKLRDEEVKQKKLQEDLQDEFRIKKELEQLDMAETNEFNTKDNNRINLKKNNELSSSPGFLPELTNRKSDPIKPIGVVDNDLKMKKEISASNNFETTAVFANYTQEEIKQGQAASEHLQKSPQKAFDNINANETNKIKDMIDLVDNK